MSDGYHIGLLIMSALAYLAPQFIQEERLYWLHAPLYVVENKGKETYYFTDEEMNKARKKITGNISRNKGLGEMMPDTMRRSMFSEEYQRMDVLKPDKDSLYLLEQLMGPDVQPRKDFIFNNVDFSEVRE